MSPVDTNPSNYINNLAAEYKTYVAEDNQHATERYTGAINNYNRYVDEVGKLPPNQIPVPDFAEAVVIDAVTGLPSIVTTNLPVCPPVAAHIPPQNNTNVQPVSGHIHIGKQTNAPGWFTVGLDDGVPNGKQVPGTSDDGVEGVFLRYSAAVGNGWYEKVGG